MSNLAFNAAPFNEDNNESNIEKKRNAHTQNKTLKNRNSATKPHVNTMIEQIHKSVDSDLESSSDLGNFTPPPAPESAGVQRCVDRITPPKTVVKGYSAEKNDGPVSLEGYQNLPSAAAENYYKEHVPYYNQINTATTQNRDELLEKLNYMIHLLEEQQDEKTGHVTEEVILYSFLGIFIIFIIDSFARAGKYVR